MTTSYRAKLKGARISPRKARLVANLVRGELVSKALEDLTVVPKKSSPLFAQLIRSAMANATDRSAVDIDRLYVQTVLVDDGPTMKRFLPRAQGRATPIRKRSCHITVEVAEL